MKKILNFAIGLSLVSIAAQAQTLQLRPLPEKFYGVTTDDINPLNDIIESLRSLPKTPITRIVYDQGMSASYYLDATTKIAGVSYVMGELADSSTVKQYTIKQYSNRTTQYLNTLGNKVDLWEIGNEVNGEWLGRTSDVVAKISNAYDLVKARGGRTALTLYYNQGCWSKKSNEMFTWAQANVPARMKSGLDYVLISYYEQDCNNLKVDWPTVFAKLAQMFPNSKIGFGEVGTADAAQKASYLTRYYTTPISLPQYVGGHFWWYFKQDMVPYTTPLWKTLSDVISAN